MFKIISVNNTPDRPNADMFLGREHTLESASDLGWNHTHTGESTLYALAIGETCVDDDGDTWERIL